MHTTPAFILLFLASTALAQTPVLVKDINPGNPSGILNTTNAAVAGNTLYFSAFNSEHGEELWKTDGTDAGTVLAKDINPDTASSQIKFYAEYKDQVYFTARNPTVGTELWRTDGIEGALLAFRFALKRRLKVFELSLYVIFFFASFFFCWQM